MRSAEAYGSGPEAARALTKPVPMIVGEPFRFAKVIGYSPHPYERLFGSIFVGVNFAETRPAKFQAVDKGTNQVSFWMVRVLAQRQA
jgi:hypothetical protein